MKIGYIGLGKMGKNMVLHMLEKGIEVVVWNRSAAPMEEVGLAGAIKAIDVEDLVTKLAAPRVVWLMLPAGPVVDEFLSKLSGLLQSNDLVIDGGNSFYKDSVSRADFLLSKGIHFMDIGVSGGPEGARNGACIMAGGDVKDYAKLEPTIAALCSPHAYGYVGPAGAGHFAKMVHNGIEYGMMEAIAEGAAVLQKSEFKYDLAKVFDIYNHRSVIESRLVGWTQSAVAEDAQLEKISAVIGATGEGEWTVNAAKELGVETPVLAEALEVRKRSGQETENFRNKVVSAMRGKFGGHKVQKEVDGSSQSHSPAAAGGPQEPRG